MSMMEFGKRAVAAAAFAIALAAVVPGAFVSVAEAAGPAAPATATKAAATKADVGEILFEGEHYLKAAPGTVLKYSFERSVRDPDKVKPGFKDVVELTLEPGEAATKRNVIVTLFKGPQHRAAGPFDNVAFNPTAILMLELHLGDFAKLLGGNPRYFKNAIRTGMREAASAEPVKVKLGTGEVDGTQFTVRPYVNDPQKARMAAFSETVYRFTVSPEVPGVIYEIRITTPAPDGGAPLVEEVTRYVEN
ncbi:hypothetical protein ABB55_08955 [Prosthecomicrobium hirschii]|uniref:Uncharacterized protein n=2 Tax=Prosthecodimorpha hirschii TaxID=665126 RepID=A0A0P6VJY4_9HYPH|nr:hypothetical protein ABB55_08955 [Prosthecomicrobium hirschii]